MEPQPPSDGVEDPCDTVSVDEIAECRPDPDKPCLGNPVKNPRIAEQDNSGIEGGRFGPTRTREDGSPKWHKGRFIYENV